MDRMGQSRRNADRKIKLDVWRARVALPIKAAGILLLAAGVACLVPVSQGSAHAGLSQFDYIAGSLPLLPIGGWLLLAGGAALAAGLLISSDWGIS